MCARKKPEKKKRNTLHKLGKKSAKREKKPNYQVTWEREIILPLSTERSVTFQFFYAASNRAAIKYVRDIKKYKDPAWRVVSVSRLVRNRKSF